MNRSAMLAAFADQELHTFSGQGGKTLTYIEDETVMDRLDVGYGTGNWQIHVEPIPYVEGVVKVRIGVREGDEWIWYEDFGYPNNKGGQELKEAVSDGIRRCGRYVGIARDLYRKEASHASAPARPVAAPARPRVVHDDDLLNDVDDADFDELRPSARDDLVTCPIHGVAWAGQPGDLWHKDPEGKYCRHPDNVRKPARAR